MNQGKLPKFMASTTSAAENMEIPLYGKLLRNFLITFPSLLLLRINSFACMEVFLLQSKL